MKARITADRYNVAPEGHTVEKYVKDDIVSGAVARFAVADKAAVELKEKGPAPETKKAEVLKPEAKE